MAAQLEGHTADRAGKAQPAREAGASKRKAGSRIGVVEVGLLVLLAWAPIPLGSFRPWSWSLLALWAGVLLVLAGTGLLWRRDLERPLSAWLLPACLLFMSVLAWASVQAMQGLPADWAHPAWALAAEAGIVGTPVISVDPMATREAVMRLGSYASIFVVALILGNEATRARRLLNTIVVILTLHAAAALVRWGAGWEYFWGVPLPLTQVSGTFPNYNHFATLANLGLVTAMALLLERIAKHTAGFSLRHGLAQVARVALDEGWLLLLACLTLAAASLLSGSRGGFLSLAVALLILFRSSLEWRGERLGTALAIIAVLAVIVGIVVWAAGDLVLGRLEDTALAQELDPTGQGRIAAWITSLPAIIERPWLGHGLGAYESVFLTLRDERFPRGIYDFAHNTYIELLVEIGVPATLVLLAALLILGWICARGARMRRQDRVIPRIGLAATVLIASHALTDFSVQIPAIAAMWSALLGLGCAQALSNRR